MSIENILDKIEKETEAAVEEIIREAKEEAAKIGKEYQKKAEDLSDKLMKEAERRADEETRRLIVNERLELRKGLLEKKREVFDGFFEAAKKEIEGMAKDDYIAFIRRLIVDKAATGKEEIVVSSKQADIYPDDFADTLNSSFKGDSAFKISDQSDEFAWGVILREGKRVVDLSLDSLFKEISEDMEPEIAGLLFSKDE